MTVEDIDVVKVTKNDNSTKVLPLETEDGCLETSADLILYPGGLTVPTIEISIGENVSDKQTTCLQDTSTVENVSDKQTTCLQDTSTGENVSDKETICLKDTLTGGNVSDKQTTCLQDTSTRENISDKETTCLKDTSTLENISDKETICLKDTSTGENISDKETICLKDTSTGENVSDKQMKSLQTEETSFKRTAVVRLENNLPESDSTQRGLVNVDIMPSSEKTLSSMQTIDSSVDHSSSKTDVSSFQHSTSSNDVSGCQLFECIRSSNRKRKAPPPRDISLHPPGWVRGALQLLHKVSRYRGSPRSKNARSAASWFLKPVVPAEAPGYFKLIKTPMDFGTIKTKLETGEYNDPSDFHKDMLLVKSNCCKYNPTGHIVRKDCDEVFQFYESEYEKFMEKVDKMNICTPKKQKQSSSSV
ncbi:transcriptional activator spt7-like [Xenia sp. Carnegie-2017]|uniref:transcriptional activator spt7-like n=1 Tax=Xenia sp. Carnegie-2017 TaxID=2897299 RepID=UPI001F04A466|nr:transcriptional activator spt7-like [Xenia sp. Carnegie-2017]XP_046854121.1 transcriptional activator spt7-like [Xenia sp. Carnegie-2017]XP_046854122.1 transcriptional activator spt7-like [Xenia sp. Carnegie-2017]